MIDLARVKAVTKKAMLQLTFWNLLEFGECFSCLVYCISPDPISMGGAAFGINQVLLCLSMVHMGQLVLPLGGE